MVTRSIVGRFLIVAVLLVSLGVIAEAALKISADAGKRVAKADPAPAPVVTAAATAVPAPAAAAPPASAPDAGAQTADAAPVRVVYPGPLGDAPVQPRKFADAAPASPLAAAPQPQAPAPAPAPVQQAAAPAPAAAPPTDVQVASADPSVGLPAAAPPTPAKGGIDLNTASVDALNRLGGGHIGQSIVKHRPYRSVEDLVKKRVVRRSVYDQIKDQLAAN